MSSSCSGEAAAQICHHDQPARRVQLPAPTDLCQLPPDDTGWLSKKNQLVLLEHVCSLQQPVLPEAGWQGSAGCLAHALVTSWSSSVTMASLHVELRCMNRVTSATHRQMRWAASAISVISPCPDRVLPFMSTGQKQWFAECLAHALVRPRPTSATMTSQHAG